MVKNDVEQEYFYIYTKQKFEVISPTISSVANYFREKWSESGQTTDI